MAFALTKYLPLLTEAVRAAEITWKKDPSQWPRYRMTFANNQQRWVLCERCRLKLHDAKKRDEAEALGSVIRPPNATAAIHENPDPDVQMPASDSQNVEIRRGQTGPAAARILPKMPILHYRSSR
jgi:hypothetical protein